MIQRTSDDIAKWIRFCENKLNGPDLLLAGIYVKRESLEEFLLDNSVPQSIGGEKANPKFEKITDNIYHFFFVKTDEN